MHQKHQEPEVYYLVPHKYGPNSKTVVRRPRPPPSTVASPLDDDFDAATTRGARTEWDGPIHRLERAISPSPSGRNVATITRKAPPKPPPAPATATTTPRPDKGAHDSYEVYGDYGRYVNELERKFGGSPDLTLSPTRSRRNQGSIGKTLKAPADASANANANAGNSRIGLPVLLGSIGKPGGAAAGPRPRQSFEIVDRRVLEDGPERTVTISTWREQVADEADQHANMDIYYLDAHDHAAEVEETVHGNEADRDGEGDREEEEATSAPETDSPVLLRKSLPAPPSQEGVSDTGSIRTITDEQSESASASITRRRTGTPSTTTRKSSERSLSRQRRSSITSGSQPGVWLWHPTPPQTPPRPLQDPALDIPRNISSPPPPPPRKNGVNESVAGSKSSPTRSTVTRSQDHPYIQPTPRSSTPNGGYLRQSASSFHPTQSGSTISTIKSASTIALEHILHSCEPSLLHVTHALARLGILNDGHLRAIARLSDETRDRELKDAALKQGITVMEWAILLDKLQML